MDGRFREGDMHPEMTVRGSRFRHSESDDTVRPSSFLANDLQLASKSRALALRAAVSPLSSLLFEWTNVRVRISRAELAADEPRERPTRDLVGHGVAVRELAVERLAPERAELRDNMAAARLDGQHLVPLAVRDEHGRIAL